MKKQNKNRNKKLSLNPETLFRLTDENLVIAAGGTSTTTCSMRSSCCVDNQ